MLDFSSINSFSRLAGRIAADQAGTHIDLADLGGGTITLAEFRGTLTAADFWFA
jgi:hypothetical protein